MQLLLVSSSFAFVLGLVLTFLVREGSLHFKLYDEPSGGRNLHTRPIPRLGGVAVVGAFVVTLGVVLLSGRRMSAQIAADSEMLSALLVGGSIILIVGVLDDLKGVRSWTKLAAQVGAASAAYACGIQVDSIGIPLIGMIELGWFALPATLFWFVAVINGLNLIDGMDGLAGTVVALSGATLCFMTLIDGNYASAVVLGALVGAVCGFLVFNANPASIFLGDTGSLFSGFVLALIAASSAQKSSAVFSLLGAILALGLPLADLTLAVVRRGLSGKGLFAADQHHIHHRLLYQGLDQRQAVGVLFAVVVGLEVLALIFVYSNGPISAVALAGTLPLMIGAYQLLGYPSVIRANRQASLLRSLTDSGRAQIQQVEGTKAALQTAETEEQAWAALEQAAESLSLEGLEWSGRGEQKCWSKARSAAERGVHLDAITEQRLPLQIHSENYGELVLTRRMETRVFGPFDVLVGDTIGVHFALCLHRLQHRDHPNSSEGASHVDIQSA